jgi:hypothetical protein
MQVQIKQGECADECHFPPKYVAIGSMPVRDVGASRELDGGHGRTHGRLKQNGVHASEPKYCAKPHYGKHVVRKMSLIN